MQLNSGRCLKYCLITVNIRRRNRMIKHVNRKLQKVNECIGRPVAVGGSSSCQSGRQRRRAASVLRLATGDRRQQLTGLRGRDLAWNDENWEVRRRWRGAQTRRRRRRRRSSPASSSSLLVLLADADAAAAAATKIPRIPRATDRPTANESVPEIILNN